MQICVQYKICWFISNWSVALKKTELLYNSPIWCWDVAPDEYGKENDIVTSSQTCFLLQEKHFWYFYIDRVLIFFLWGNCMLYFKFELWSIFWINYNFNTKQFPYYNNWISHCSAFISFIGLQCSIFDD